MKVSAKEMFVFLKLSIIQFLLNKNFIFLNRDNDIYFDLKTIFEEKIDVEISISIEQNGMIVVYTNIPFFKEDFDNLNINSDTLVSITNIINQCVQNFTCCCIKNEDYISFVIKRPLILQVGTILDYNFWEEQIKNQIEYSSILTDFLFLELQKLNVKDENFSNQIYIFIKSHIDAINLYHKQEQKSQFISFSKEELEEKIDKELENFSYIINNTNDIKDKNKINMEKQKSITKLNILVSELNKKDKNDIDNS